MWVLIINVNISIILFLLAWMNMIIIDYHGVVIAGELPLSEMSAAASGITTPVIMNITTNMRTRISTIMEGNATTTRTNSTTITSTKGNDNEELI